MKSKAAQCVPEREGLKLVTGSLGRKQLGRVGTSKHKRNCIIQKCKIAREHKNKNVAKECPDAH